MSCIWMHGIINSKEMLGEHERWVVNRADLTARTYQALVNDYMTKTARALRPQAGRPGFELAIAGDPLQGRSGPHAGLEDHQGDEQAHVPGETGAAKRPAQDAHRHGAIGQERLEGVEHKRNASPVASGGTPAFDSASWTSASVSGPAFLRRRCRR